MSENYNATGEVKEISILDMMNGAIGERVAYELTRIMKNCRDFNLVSVDEVESLAGGNANGRVQR